MLLAHVVGGLSVTDDGFDAWHDRLAAANVRLFCAARSPAQAASA